jgi:site-specific recombinase XerD
LLSTEGELFLTHLAKERQLSENTLVAYRRDLEDLEHFLSDYSGTAAWQWQEVDRLTVRSFLGWCQGRRLSKRTIARKLSAMRTFFRFLNVEEKLEQNPARGIRLTRRERHLPEHLTRKEVDPLFSIAESAASENSLEGMRTLVILELFYGSGLRLAELHDMNMEDLDLIAGQAKVRGKGRKERIVPLTSASMLAIRRYEPRRREVGAANGRGPLVVNAQGGRFSRRSIQRAVERLLDAAGVQDGVSTHSLRHSFATHHIDAGADLMAVKELLGQASLTTTQIYTHTSKERLRQVYRDAHPRA